MDTKSTGTLRNRLSQFLTFMCLLLPKLYVPSELSVLSRNVTDTKKKKNLSRMPNPQECPFLVWSEGRVIWTAEWTRNDESLVSSLFQALVFTKLNGTWDSVLMHLGKCKFVKTRVAGNMISNPVWRSHSQTHQCISWPWWPFFLFRSQWYDKLSCL